MWRRKKSAGLTRSSWRRIFSSSFSSSCSPFPYLFIHFFFIIIFFFFTLLSFYLLFAFILPLFLSFPFLFLSSLIPPSLLSPLTPSFLILMFFISSVLPLEAFSPRAVQRWYSENLSHFLSVSDITQSFIK